MLIENQPLVLPSRPQKSTKALLKYQPITLLSNHYQVKIDAVQRIYIYHLDFEPRLVSDSRDLRQKLIESIRRDLMKEIGFFVLTGSTIYGIQAPTFDKVFVMNGHINDQDYVIKLTLTRDFQLSAFNDERNQKESFISYKFMNILIKSFLKRCDFFEFGRTSRYFNKSVKEVIEETNLVALRGFITSFNSYKDGLFLKIDIAHKILRTDTVLTSISSIYREHEALAKEEKRRLVKELLVGKTVLGMYGNYRYWRIDDIDFDLNCENFEFVDENDPTGRKHNMLTYYKEKYELTIKNAKQPLLIHRQTKTDKVFHLVPELCVMTGIPEDTQDQLRRKIASFCIKDPSDRMGDIQKLTNMILSNEETQKQCSSLGVDISTKPVQLEGKHLALPTLIFGRDEKLSHQVSNFKKPVYQDAGAFPWAIIHFRDFSPNNLVQTFRELARTFEIDLEKPQTFNLGECVGRKSVGEIEDMLYRKIDKKFDLVVVVLPNQIRFAYKNIKKICYLDLALLSQVVMSKTFEKKGYESICAKVLQQIAAKHGSKLWVVKSPEFLPQKTMLVGANISNDKGESSRSVVGFCATIDGTFSKYYNRVAFQKKSKEIIENIRLMFKEAILEWFGANKCVPEYIIFFRDGVSESQEVALLTIEIPQIIEAFKDIYPEYCPKIAVIIIDKRISQKFFWCDKSRLSNPPPGTLIDDVVVTKNYDFYLISQNVNRGTATPTHYRVIYDTTEIPQEVIQELIYSQCYAYWNWTGAIRVPAPVQYANKLSLFIGQNLNNDPRKELRKKLYYL